MSETGRASLKLIFDSDPYKAWAAVPANLPEVTKVNKAYAGQPCAQTGGGQYVFRPVIGYYECNRFF